MKCWKQRDAQKFGPLTLSFQEVLLQQTNEEEINSFILVPEKSRPRGNSSSKKAIAEKAIVAILEINNDLKYSALVNALPYESVVYCQRQSGAVK